MSFEVGAVLEDAAWQAPEYCFTKDGGIAETAGEHHDDSFVGSSPGVPCEDLSSTRVGSLWSVEMLCICATAA